jgi:hypothetical protein
MRGNDLRHALDFGVELSAGPSACPCQYSAKATPVYPAVLKETVYSDDIDRK